MMEQLWTPWRMEYIRRKRAPGEPCLFCRAPELGDLDARIIARSESAYALLNRYPYSYGHTMIAPFAHLPSPEALSDEALADLMRLGNRVMRVLRHVCEPPAFNIGANIGAAAGAGIAEHFHFHVVPRWPGDANFMVAIGGTQTIPDTLDNIAEDMRAAWGSLFGEAATDDP